MIQGIQFQYRLNAAGADRVRVRQYRLNGAYETLTDAYYLEDNWQISDNILVTAGIRNEAFDNRNNEGDSFIKIDDQWAPRVGLSWDVAGDGTSKFFANYGRYFLPVANNTNQRLAGNELFVQQTWAFSGINADGTPILTNPTSGVGVFSNGVTKDTRSLVDQAIDPMYQDEFMIGFQQEVAEGWALGVRGIHRDLKSSLEDVAIDAGLNRYAAQNGIGLLRF
jgi:TonB dependent receptor